MNGKTARKLRKIATNENRHKRTVYKTYLQLGHADKRLFILTGINRILETVNNRGTL